MSLDDRQQRLLHDIDQLAIRIIKLEQQANNRTQQEPSTLPSASQVSNQQHKAEEANNDKHQHKRQQHVQQSHVKEHTQDKTLVATPLSGASPWGPGTHPRTDSLASVVEDLTALCHRVGFSPFLFKSVPSNYYDLSLEERRSLLSAPSVDHLCKSIVMENVRCDTDAPDSTRYVMIEVQYVRKLHKEKLNKVLSVMQKQSKNKQNWRLADEEHSDRLTGYTHNSVAPLGSLTPMTMLISHHVLHVAEECIGNTPAAHYIWLGGGHTDLKWQVQAKQLAAAFQATFEDITYD